MAQRVSNGTGNWSAAATWDQVTNAPTTHVSTNLTLSSGNTFTAGYTAPNTTNKATGVLLYINTAGTDGTITVTLQESTVDTTATASMAMSGLKGSGWYYFRFGTPYTFTTTTASAYRIRITLTGATTTTNISADSGGTNAAFIATDNRNVVPATTDTVIIAGNNGTNAVTVTLDSNQTVGAAAYTSLIFGRTNFNDVIVSSMGTLAWSQTASATLICKGMIVIYDQGEIDMGTVASPMPSSFTARLSFNPTTSGDFGILQLDGGKFFAQGTPKSSTSLWKTKYVSGDGSVGNPLIVTDSVNWSVGDEILVGSTDSVGHTESRTISTVNSATSYVLSSALTNTHTTNAWILNVQRNVLIDTQNTARAWYLKNQNTTAVNTQIKWARFETVGSSTAGKNGISIYDAVSAACLCDYSVAYRPLWAGWYFNNGTAAQTHTGLIACYQSSAAVAGSFHTASRPNNKTFVDCFAMSSGFLGWEFLSMYNSTFTRCYAIDNNSASNSVGGGMLFAATGGLTFNNCEVHVSNVQGIVLDGASGVTYNSLLAGTKGSNTADVGCAANTFNNAWLFYACTFGSATLVTGYLGQLPGSVIAFHNLNNTTNNHKWYTNTGSAQSCGTGLTDTNVRTSGSLALRLSPEDNITGFQWTFNVVCTPSEAAFILGYLQQNSTFAGDSGASLKVDLYLPGSSTPDVTQNMSADTTWDLFNLAKSYPGSVVQLATIVITAKSVTPGAYVYVDDIYNGTNKISGLDTWFQGQPLSTIVETLGDAQAIWGVSTAALTAAGTTGQQLNSALTTGKFLALK